MIDAICQTVIVRGGPVADSFGDAFTRETQLSFDDLGMNLDELIAEDAYLFNLYFSRKFPVKKSTTAE